MKVVANLKKLCFKPIIPCFCWIFFLIVSIECQERQGLFIRGRRPLPIDGQWNSWAAWSECYLNTKTVKNFYEPLENFYIQSRNRTCDNPKPINGGDDCLPPSHRFKQCGCMNPLGMSTKLISDLQISSTKHYQNYSPSQGRIGDNYAGWCSHEKESHFNKIYLEIDFGKFANVGAIDIQQATKGRVTQFSVEYSLNGLNWHQISPKESRYGQKFKGNLYPGLTERALFRNHKVMKHLRVIPMKSYGLKPCLKIEPLGCVFTCGEIHTASFGKISANSQVDFDQNCLWRIEVLNTTALSFDFIIFDILCEHGYLDFHDGSSDFTDSPLLKRICLKDRDEEFPMIKINSNKIWLNFVSNSSDYEDSFSLKYFSQCTQTLNLNLGEPAIIKSPNFPNKYFGNMDCSWTLYPPKKDDKIDLMFTDFSVESSTTLCSDDSVTIKYYNDNSETILGTFCNDKKPLQKYSVVADRIFIYFRTDPIHSDKGFRISAQSGTKLLPTQKQSTPGFSHKSVGTDVISTSINGNNTYNGTQRKKKTPDKGSDWTIITISAFSALVVFLLCWVIGNNIKRFLNNRNEVEAHCAKIKAANAEKLLKEQKRASNIERSSLLQSPRQEIEIVASPKHKTASLFQPKNNLKTPNTENGHTAGNDDDNVDGELSPLMSTHLNGFNVNRTLKQQHSVRDSMHSHTDAEVDMPDIDFEGTTDDAQDEHIVNKLNSSDISIKEGRKNSNGSDIESCV